MAQSPDEEMKRQFNYQDSVYKNTIFDLLSLPIDASFKTITKAYRFKNIEMQKALDYQHDQELLKIRKAYELVDSESKLKDYTDKLRKEEQLAAGQQFPFTHGASYRSVARLEFVYIPIFVSSVTKNQTQLNDNTLRDISKLMDKKSAYVVSLAAEEIRFKREEIPQLLKNRIRAIPETQKYLVGRSEEDVAIIVRDANPETYGHYVYALKVNASAAVKGAMFAPTFAGLNGKSFFILNATINMTDMYSMTRVPFNKNLVDLTDVAKEISIQEIVKNKNESIARVIIKEYLSEQNNQNKGIKFFSKMGKLHSFVVKTPDFSLEEFKKEAPAKTKSTTSYKNLQSETFFTVVKRAESLEEIARWIKDQKPMASAKP